MHSASPDGYRDAESKVTPGIENVAAIDECLLQSTCTPLPSGDCSPPSSAASAATPPHCIAAASDLEFEDAYELKALLGTGAYGRVYAASQNAFGRARENAPV